MSFLLFKNNLLINLEPLSIIDKSIVIGLSITVAIFLILLLLGIRKTYKLQAENERLANLNFGECEEEEKKYKDFTEGHLYSNN